MRVTPACDALTVSCSAELEMNGVHHRIGLRKARIDDDTHGTLSRAHVADFATLGWLSRTTGAAGTRRRSASARDLPLEGHDRSVDADGAARERARGRCERRG
jgi:hypothetical protein